MMTVIFLLQLNWQSLANFSNKLVVSALDMREYVLHYRNSADVNIASLTLKDVTSFLQEKMPTWTKRNKF